MNIRMKVFNYSQFEHELNRWMSQPPRPYVLPPITKYILPMMALGGVLGIAALTVPLSAIPMLVLLAGAAALYLGVFRIISKHLPRSE